MSEKRSARQALAANACQPSPSEDTPATQRARNESLIELLDEWMANDSGYDEAVWPRVKQAIQENRLSYRSRLSD